MYCTIIVAVSTDGFIADVRGNTITTSEQDAHFLHTQLLQHTVHIMGRKTFQKHASKKPLAHTKRFVLTHQPQKYSQQYANAATFTATPVSELLMQHALLPCLILGGAHVYQAALTSGYVTQVYVVVEPLLLHAGTPFLSTTTLAHEGYVLQSNTTLNDSGTKLLQYVKN